MSARLSTLCLVLAMSLHIGLAQQCDDGYEFFPSYPTSRYKLPPYRLPWVQALAACESDGGGAHLVVMNSDEEAKVVGTLVTRLDRTHYHFAWVGINDLDVEGTWRTVLGGLVSESGYNRWFGNPSNYTDENCAFVYHDAGYNDYYCTATFYFICEKPNA